MLKLKPSRQAREKAAGDACRQLTRDALRILNGLPENTGKRFTMKLTSRPDTEDSREPKVENSNR